MAHLRRTPEHMHAYTICDTTHALASQQSNTLRTDSDNEDGRRATTGGWVVFYKIRPAAMLYGASHSKLPVDEKNNKKK